jgi:EmrB/QacA subfamily drug resistance transporter
MIDNVNSMDNRDYRRYVLIASTMAAFLTPFMGSSINIALPTIGSELSMDAISLSWVPTAYLIATGALLLPFGRLADIFGRKRIFDYGILLLTASSLACAFSISVSMLIITRVIQGIASAMIFGNSVAMLTSAYPLEERGKVLGINVAAVYLGLSVAPFLGGILTQHFGWRSILITAGLIGAITSTISLWKIKKDWASSEGDKFDVIGSIFYIAALVLFMYGLTQLPDLAGLWFILGGLATSVIFIKWSSSISIPILDITLFRHNRVFIMSNIATLINYSATFAVAVLLSLYLQYIKGMPPQTAGLVLIAQPITQSAISPLAGRLSDRYQPRLLASLGMGAITIGLALFSQLSSSTILAFIIPILVFIGFGYALFSSPNVHAVMGSVSESHQGIASATVATMRQLGMTLSMAIAMLLFSIYIGRVQITPEYYDGFLQSVRTAFIVFACLCLIGVLASLVRGKVRYKPGH